MFAGALLTAFLYPRSVVVNIIGLNGTAVNNVTYLSTGSFDNDSYILLGVQVSFFTSSCECHDCIFSDNYKY